MFEFQQVTKRFGAKTILDHLSLSLPPDRVTCLLGPSGCGKTTLLRLAAGLITPDAGTIVAPKSLRISYVFQEDRLLPWYSALENLTALGIDEAAARDALARVLLCGEEASLPANLSGGMQRRLSIARALAHGGDFFFLDEPLRGLDPATAEPVLAALRSALSGKGALLITHSAEEAYALGDVLWQVSGPPVAIMRTANVSHFHDVEALKTWQQDSPR